MLKILDLRPTQFGPGNGPNVDDKNVFQPLWVYVCESGDLCVCAWERFFFFTPHLTNTANNALVGTARFFLQLTSGLIDIKLKKKVNGRSDEMARNFYCIQAGLHDCFHFLPGRPCVMERVLKHWWQLGNFTWWNYERKRGNCVIPIRSRVASVVLRMRMVVLLNGWFDTMNTRNNW